MIGISKINVKEEKLIVILVVGILKFLELKNIYN